MKITLLSLLKRKLLRMIILNKNTSSEVIIYKSNFNYSTSGSYTMKLIEDITNTSFNISFTIDTTNELITKFNLNTNSVNNYGFYTLNIYSGVNIVYSERCVYRNNNVLNDGENTIIFYEGDDDNDLIIE